MGASPLWKMLPLNLSCLLLENTPDGQNLFVIRSGDDNAGLAVGCMHNITVTDIQSHMAGITDQVSGQGVGQTVHRIPLLSVRRGRVRQRHAEVSVYAHHEAGTVCTVGQAGTAPFVRISHKLYSEVGHRHAHLIVAADGNAGGINAMAAALRGCCLVLGCLGLSGRFPGLLPVCLFFGQSGGFLFPGLSLYKLRM